MYQKLADGWRVYDNPETASRLIASGSGMAKALMKHKGAGNPIATWKDGKVVLVQPKAIAA